MQSDGLKHDFKHPVWVLYFRVEYLLYTEIILRDRHQVSFLLISVLYIKQIGTQTHDVRIIVRKKFLKYSFQTRLKYKNFHTELFHTILKWFEKIFKNQYKLAI